MAKGRGRFSRARGCGLSLAMLVAGASPAWAQGDHRDDAWRFDASLYLWGTSIDARTQRGSDVHVSFRELLQHLDFATMGLVEVRKDRWSVLADLVYARVSGGKSGTISAGDNPDGISVNADVDAKAWVVDLQGARTVHRNKHVSVDVLLGTRYLDLSSTLTVGVARLPARTIKPTITSWDGVAGGKGSVRLSRHWSLPFYVDVGTGQADFTWQAFGGVTYSIKRWDLYANYRRIYWNTRSGGLDDIALTGPRLGVLYRF